jgi:hypothetical protein
MTAKQMLTVWLLSLLPFRKIGSETVNAVHIKKILVDSLVIFKLKMPGLSSQDLVDWFWFWDGSPSPHWCLCLRVPGSKKHQDNFPSAYLPDLGPADFFLLQRVWPLAVPG